MFSEKSGRKPWRHFCRFCTYLAKALETWVVEQPVAHVYRVAELPGKRERKVREKAVAHVYRVTELLAGGQCERNVSVRSSRARREIDVR